MVIIQCNGTFFTEDDVIKGKVNDPTGTLYFTTKSDAENYEHINKFGDGTVCYTKVLDVGVLDNGTWSWK